MTSRQQDHTARPTAARWRCMPPAIAGEDPFNLN
jgi:hypothetical protein